ncbi:hypothetical protein BD289DRAFT_352238, partial [Coniella lustricola]
LRSLVRLLVPLSLVLTVYLHLYPLFLACGFPLPSSAPAPAPAPTYRGQLAAWLETLKLHLSSSPSLSHRLAPFRLLAIGDPQLEGDTSIPNAYSDSSFPHLDAFFARLATRTSEYPTARASTKQALHDLVDFCFDDIPNTLESVRKRIDLFGNDLYLAHMYRTLRWWTLPTHVTVLGDLLGSQWISDDEFARRGARYWDRVFEGGERVPDQVAAWPGTHAAATGVLDTALRNATWQRRIINVAGNHDIGYAGDITQERMDRFERVFGKANYELRFDLAAEALSVEAADSVRAQHADRLAPQLRIVNLNDLNLDTPAANIHIQDETYRFINHLIDSSPAVEHKGHFTVLLTHVPLYKAAGICVDAPYFSFHDEDGTLKEQNQLSADASRGIVQGVFGLSGDPTGPGRGQGRRGVILNGHDHEGCDTYHFINQSHGASAEERDWQATPWRSAATQGIALDAAHPGVREITVRSIMGGYGGNAGLLSAWFDEDSWEWRFEYAECALGTQHIWWAVHILDLVTVVAVVAYAV